MWSWLLKELKINNAFVLDDEESIGFSGLGQAGNIKSRPNVLSADRRLVNNHGWLRHHHHRDANSCPNFGNFTALYHSRRHDLPLALEIISYTSKWTKLFQSYQKIPSNGAIFSLLLWKWYLPISKSILFWKVYLAFFVTFAAEIVKLWSRHIMFSTTI